ncbi:hypothetical protein MLD38_025143 [Melastoma candidum]|uniref:Uncharacterized protein n=1 Tax=Melastoma candidum TaxID=119954 RepID=A0ACB9NXC2_9MYRT|nr:hypothetical protein MLD38_025143 [Melastoma candidum]
MLERCLKESPASEEDVDGVLESLKQRRDESIVSPFCVSSPAMRMKAEGIGTMVGRLLLGTAEKIPPTELVDTTGAGDAFIGGIIYALCTDMPSERMLPFASKVAAEVCRSLGTRAGLPRLMDPCLSSLLL